MAITVSFLLSILSFCACDISILDNGWVMIQADEPEPGAALGSAVATSGVTVAVSQPYKKHPSTMATGSVLYYSSGDGINLASSVPSRSVTEFFHEAPDTQQVSNSNFGTALAMPDPSSVLIGSPSMSHTVQGQIIFSQSPFKKQDFRVTTLAEESTYELGLALAASPLRVVVGCPSETVDEQKESGVAYIYSRSVEYDSPSDWAWDTMIKSPSPAVNERCGSSLAISADERTVASGCDDGKVLIISKFVDSDPWSSIQIVKVEPEIGVPKVSVQALALSFDGLFLFVGVEISPPPGSGVVLIYSRDSPISGDWIIFQHITDDGWPLSPSTDSLFGASLSFHEGRLAIGAPLHSNVIGIDGRTSFGGVWLLAYDSELRQFVFEDAFEGNDINRGRFVDANSGDFRFGHAISLQSNFLLVGSPGYESSTAGLDSGAAFVIPLEPKPSNRSSSTASSTEENASTSSTSIIRSDSALFSSLSFAGSPSASKASLETEPSDPPSNLSIFSQPVMIGSIAGTAALILLLACIIVAVLLSRRGNKKAKGAKKSEPSLATHRPQSHRGASSSRSRSGTSRSRAGTSSAAMSNYSSSAVLRRAASRSKMTNQYEMTDFGGFDSESSHKQHYDSSSLANSSNYLSAPIERKGGIEYSEFTSSTEGNYAIFCSVCSKQYPTKEDLAIHKSRRGH